MALQTEAGITKRRAGDKALAPPKTSAVQVLQTDDMQQHRVAARKMAEDKVRARTMARAQAAAEKLSTATTEVSTAIQVASSAIHQLEKTTQGIASAAREASGAADESRAAIGQIECAASQALKNVDAATHGVRDLQGLVRIAANDISALIAGVGEAAKANIESARMITELEKLSNEIGKIVHAVARIADQTNLLALNAAIEAARAGDHGKGFAVVADEVRNLAELSEKSARGIQEVVSEIQGQVKVVVSDTEAAGRKAAEAAGKAQVITRDLQEIETDIQTIQGAFDVMSANALQAANGTKDYYADAQQIATAAEESSAACEETLRSIEEQAKAYNEMSDAAAAMADLAEELRTSTSGRKSAEELAASSEELSANADEVRSAARQIATAIEQIEKAATVQARAAEKSTLLGQQLTEGARISEQRATESAEKVASIQDLLRTNKGNVEELISNIESGAVASVASAKNVKELEERTRRIDKIVDAIVMVTVQTNMLAVNGNVEAARAGEFGRGFSVVAGDIRSLSNESSENADRIKDLVRQVQTQIARVASDIDLAGKTAAAEVAKAKATTVHLDQMVRDMDLVREKVESFANDARDACKAFELTAKATEQISSAAEETVRATEEAAHAAEEAAHAAQQIAHAVEEIASQADELQHG